MNLQRLHLQSDKPNHKLEWKRGDGDVIVEQFGYARLIHVVNTSADRDAYDQIVWAYYPGAVCVIVNSAGKLGLVKTFRAAPITSDSQELWDPDELDFSKHGRISWEFPRGDSKTGEDALQTAKREAAEETGLCVSVEKVLGYTNQNTAYNLFNTPVVLARATKEQSAVPIDPTEDIGGVDFKSPIDLLAMIRDGEIICGHTKSAFAMYIAEFPNAISQASDAKGPADS